MDQQFKLIIKAKFKKVKLHWRLYDQPIVYLKKVRHIIPKGTLLVEADPKHPFDKIRLQHKQFSAN